MAGRVIASLRAQQFRVPKRVPKRPLGQAWLPQIKDQATREALKGLLDQVAHVSGHVAQLDQIGLKVSSDTYFAKNYALRADLPYENFRTLSIESRQKLGAIQPSSLAQAARIPGVSPADLQNLVIEVERLRRG